MCLRKHRITSFCISRRKDNEQEYIVDVDHLTIRFNMASEKVDNLKEYVIKLIKHELMFQEFLALKDVNLKVKKGEAW